MFDPEVVEVVAGLDALGSAERRVIEVGPGGFRAAVVERDGRFAADVEAGVGLAGRKSLDGGELEENRVGIDHPVKLAEDLRVGCRNRAGIQTQVEQRGVDPAPAHGRQLRVDPVPASTLEAAHQRAVEEDQIGHDRNEILLSMEDDWLARSRAALCGFIRGFCGSALPSSCLVSCHVPSLVSDWLAMQQRPEPVGRAPAHRLEDVGASSKSCYGRAVR